MKAALIALALALAGSAALAAELASYTVSAQPEGAVLTATGTISAVRHGTVAAQVAGRITEVLVRNGDAVSAGQPLLHIEPGDSEAAATAAEAATSSAAARLASVRADYERAQRLRAQDFISVAGLQRAEAALRTAESDARAADAGASGARTRAGWHVIRAPYAGRVTELWVSAGDLATPGRPLLAVLDPTELRVVAQLPESLAAGIAPDRPAQLLVSGKASVALSTWQVIPAVDAITHSVEVRAEIPGGTQLQPGQFATLLLPLRAATTQLRIPKRAVLRRSEVTGVYVIDEHGAAHLRQLRLGSVSGDTVSVLSGLQSGERIALDPAAAGAH